MSGERKHRFFQRIFAEMEKRFIRRSPTPTEFEQRIFMLLPLAISKTSLRVKYFEESLSITKTSA